MQLVSHQCLPENYLRLQVRMAESRSITFTVIGRFFSARGASGRRLQKMLGRAARWDTRRIRRRSGGGADGDGQTEDCAQKDRDGC